MTHILCRIFGHAMAARYSSKPVEITVTLGSILNLDTGAAGALVDAAPKYLGEVCPRCGASSPDKLSPPPVITPASHARLFIEGREPVDIAVDHVDASASRCQGVEFTIRGRQL